MQKHFLSITDITSKELIDILFLAKSLKEQQVQSGENGKVLNGKTLAMIFEKPSLRTRLSFEIAMTQLGGHAVYLGPNDIAMGTREPIKDIAKVTSSMADMIMARTFLHETVEELAKYSDVPIINGLSDLEHPCQTLADLLTIFETKGTFKGLKIAFIGDGNNNITHSLCLGASLLGMHFACSSPTGFFMQKEIVAKAKIIAQKTGAKILETNKPQEAIKDADIVYTDTWISMGKESEKESRIAKLTPYQITSTLMKLAKSDAIFMHDMPAYRGHEVTENVIDGKQSVIYKQAENRLHAQKALICFLFRH